MVFHVAGRPHAFNIGGADIAVVAAACNQVTRVVHIQLAFEQRRIRLMADGDKHAVHRNFRQLAVIRAQAHARHTRIVAQNFINLRIGFQHDFAFFHALHQFFHHDFFRTERVAAVNQCNRFGDIGQIQRFFYRRIAAAHHGHILPLIEKAVASRARRHAASRKLLFAGQPQIFGRSTRGDNQRITGIFAHVAFERERAVLQIGRVDLVEHDFRAETFGVFQEMFHQFRALNAVGESRVVVHFGGGH